MSAKMQDLANQWRNQWRNHLEDMLADMSQREELAYQRGYRQCLKDAHLQLAALDSYQPTETQANAGHLISNGGDTVIAPSLGPVSTRAVEYIKAYPGATRREVHLNADVRGEGVLDKLCACGIIRKDVRPAAERTAGESYVRYYPA